MKRFQMFVMLIAVVLFSVGMLSGQVCDHPSKLKFKTLTYNPPKATDYRSELSNGMVVYIQVDNLLPTLDIQSTIRTGSIYDPKEKIGLAAMTGDVMRSGGTANISGDDLDERLAFLGASIYTSIDSDSGDASLSVMIKDQKEGLKLFADVLMNPAFPEDKIKLYKDRTLDRIKNKNNSPRSILGREFNKVLYGAHPITNEATEQTINAITKDDLRAFHKKYYAPNNIILSVSGDFNKEQMLKQLEETFSGWQKKKIGFPGIPDVVVKDNPGVFMVQKDINQGYVNVGHFGIKDTNPDIFTINVMNFILGGGSFTSRITTKVRSDEGLAYNTGCRFANRHDFPGLFYGYVQTKSATVHFAISLILDEFRKIRDNLVSDEEMETAKSYYVDSLPSRFTNPISTMSNFADLEYKGFPLDYYETYCKKYGSVTKEDVMRVAKKYIRPDKMSIMVIGDVESCKAGYDKHKGTLDEFGLIKVVELKDPLTGK